MSDLDSSRYIIAGCSAIAYSLIFLQFHDSREKRERKVRLNVEREEIPDDAECRLCFDDSSAGKMIAPCRCKGTMGYIHVACLNRWRRMTLKSTLRCEICLYRYQFYRPLKHRLFWGTAAIAGSVSIIGLIGALKILHITLILRRPFPVDRTHAFLMALPSFGIGDYEYVTYGAATIYGIFQDLGLSFIIDWFFFNYDSQQRILQLYTNWRTLRSKFWQFRSVNPNAFSYIWSNIGWLDRLSWLLDMVGLGIKFHAIHKELSARFSTYGEELL